VFDLDNFIDSCRQALHESLPAVAVQELLNQVLTRPGEVEDAFGPPTHAELVPLFASAQLTVLRLVWAPGMELPPHDHRMWAVIGIYGGQEDNRFYRRSGDGLTASGGKSLLGGDTLVLGTDVIHSVANPDRRHFTGSIHVYGGDFFNQPRSLWDIETMVEEPATGQRMRALFDDANANMVRSEGDDGPGRETRTAPAVLE
jgi:predicted metal-dependent enzyme (double-stranded beta helix superfamily)